MKNIRTLLFATLLLALASVSYAQSVGINSDGLAPNSSAMLDVKSLTKGFLAPRMTEAQKNAIDSPATGLLIFQTNETPGFYYYNGSSWSLVGTGSGSETDPVFGVSAASGITGTNISNWNSAFDWGNHASAGYLTTYTETDPVFGASTAFGISASDITNWNALESSQWTTTGSDIYYNSGNVGIGTAAPSSKLQINDGTVTNGTNTQFAIYGGRTNTTNAEYANIFFGERSDGAGAGAKISAFTGNNNYETDLAFSTSKNVGGSSGLTEAMRINESGNVGIGTTTPAYKLDVDGSINGTSVFVNGVAVASSTDTYWSTAGSGKIYYSGGNVGVGTATPAYPLDVTGDVNVTGTFRINGTAMTGTGTVTSVDASGGATGLTFSGGPVTSSGTLTLAGTLALANGGTGAATAAGARSNLGATTLGSSMFTLTNPSAITFPQFNANNTVSALTAANFRTAIGAGTGGGSVTSVTGTLPISVATGTTTPAISLGTVTVANGGIGLTTYAVGDLLYASTTSALSKLADEATGNALISGGIGTAPSWGKIALTTHVSGTLPIANGGTGTASSPTQYGVVYASSTSAYASTAAGTAGQVLTSNGTSAPSWSSNIGGNATTATSAQNLAGGTSGSIPWQNAAGVTVFTAAGTSGYLLKSNGTSAPTWLQTIPVTNGGTGSTSATVQGGVVYGESTSAMASTAAGTSGQVLTSNGTSAPTWSSTASIGVAPVGSIMIWAGSSAPTGWLLCDGTAYTTAAYPALYAVIGTTYGTGIGFLVPNLKGKIPVGLNSADVSFDARGETGGEKTHTIVTAELPSHDHTFTGTAHNHTVNPTSFNTATEGAHTHGYNAPEENPTGGRAKGDGTGTVYTTPRSTSSTTGSGGSHYHAIDVPSTTSSSTTATGTVGNTGSGTAMNVLQPYIVLYYIIKY